MLKTVFTMNQLSEVCRTCLLSSKCLEPLDTEYEEGCSLKSMLTTFCTLQMDDISEMYDNICKDCSSEILRAYNFKLQCEQNDVLLREKAQSLKLENFCKEEAIDISIVKNEVDTCTQFYLDEDKADVYVKEEDWMEGDDHRESDDDTLLNVIKRRDKLSKSKKRKKPSKSAKVPAVEDKTFTESVEKSKKCGRKRKSIPQDRALLIDQSFQTLGYRRVYECPKCGNLCKSFKMIHKHLEKFHSIILKSVEEFNEMCVQERKARGIQESQEEDKDVKNFDPKNPMYKCIECPHRCKEFDVMKKHIIQQHREAKYIRCAEEECQYSTHDLRRIVQHIKLMHRTERRYSCDKCDYKCQSKYTMDLHYTNKHLNIKPFVCHLCAKEFRANQGLQNHIAVRHEKRVKYSCPTCTKGFYIHRHLREHMKTHTGVKPHICEHCGTAFTQKANLEKHVFIVHSSSQERNLPCPECPYKAKNIYSLDNHMRRHRSNVKFYCDYCGKSFTSKDGVKRHIWRHLEWKPYKCMTCSYSCYNNNRLKKHVRRHTGERPFPCQLCDYRSISKERLTSHMESHLNKQRFACQHCPYTANYRYNLKRHLKTRCGKLTRNYTARKNKAAIDFTHLNINRLIAVDGDPSTNALMDVTDMKLD